MKIDALEQVGMVTREIGRRMHEGREARVAIASRSYDTTIDDLWDALTSAERIPRWFLPISGDLRLGGRYKLEGNAGGKITQCEPPRLLAVTWEYGDQVSWVTVRLREDGAKANLELEHIAHVDDKLWDQFGPGAVGVGWDLSLALGLAVHLATGAAVDREQAMAWPTTEEGREFIRRASDDWGRASIADGTDPASAKAAAARTTAFYTGEDPPGG